MAYRKNSKPSKAQVAAASYQDTGVPNGNTEGSSMDDMPDDEMSMELPDGAELSVEDGGIEMEMPEEEAMSEEEIQNIVSGEIDDAQSYIDDVISPERAEAGQYYKGEPFGNEEEGRSQVVSMDVRDTVQAIMPSIMRVFFGSSKVVEYAPNRAEDIQIADQATDYVNYCLTRDNNLFIHAYAMFKDALIRKNGFGKIWWDETEKVETYEIDGIDENGYMVLMSDPDVELQEVEVEYMEQEMATPEGIVTVVQMPTYSAKVVRRTKEGRLNVAALPPEEFLIDRRAKSLNDFDFIGHRRYMTVSELVAMGYEQDEVEQLGYETQDDFEGNQEAFDRNPQATILGAGRTDVASRKVLYIEGYLYIDVDGDGIAELRKVCVGGSAYKLLHQEAVDDHPFFDFCPDPEPHTFFGMSIADVVMDIQRIKSSIMRNTLDSLAQSIYPRMGVVEGQVSIEDVLNTEVGGIIRMKQQGAVQPFVTPNVSSAAFPMLEYMDAVKESRTGITKASAGLDPNALANSTATAVNATVTASQQHIELICRLFAETGFKTMMTKALKLLVKNQDKPRLVRLRNEFVPIDPRVWDANMDVVVNVALGTGSDQQKMGFLNVIAQKQEMIMQQLGPVGNPLVSLDGYYNTLEQMLAVAGFKDVSQFFQNPQGFQPPAPPAPQPSPEQILAQVQAQSIQADIQKKAAELELQREEMLLKDDRERDKIDAEVMIKAAEIEAKYGTAVNTANIEALMQRDRELLRQQGNVQKAMVAAQQQAQAAQDQQFVDQLAEEQMAQIADQEQGMM
jgi:hypothetical protein